MNDGASLIFRNKLILSGTEKEPIFIKPNSSDSIWGTIALQGIKTKGSRIENVVISGGSGYESANNKYSGMLSIHDTKDILLENITLKDNHIFDDIVHFVYSYNINLNNWYILRIEFAPSKTATETADGRRQ